MFLIQLYLSLIKLLSTWAYLSSHLENNNKVKDNYLFKLIKSI